MWSKPSFSHQSAKMDGEYLKKQEELFRKNFELDRQTQAIWKRVDDALKQEKETSLVTLRANKSLTYRASLEDDIRRRTTNNSTCLRRNEQSSNFSQGVENPSTSFSTHEEGSAVIPALPPNRSGLSNCNADYVIPKESQDIGEKATLRFLKAKVKVLQEELSILQANLKKQSSELLKTQNNLQKSEEERQQFQQQAKRMQKQLEKQEQVATEALQKCVGKDTEITSLKKEVQKLKKEIKSSIHYQQSNDIRLNRTLEEAEKLKTALKNMELEEKERVNNYKKKYDEVMRSLKKVEAQKGDLITAFKQQLQLIDNLQRQKVHLENLNVIRASEKEFLKFLNWDPDQDQKHTK